MSTDFIDGLLCNSFLISIFIIIGVPLSVSKISDKGGDKAVANSCLLWVTAIVFSVGLLYRSFVTEVPQAAHLTWMAWIWGGFFVISLLFFREKLTPKQMVMRFIMEFIGVGIPLAAIWGAYSIFVTKPSAIEFLLLIPGLLLLGMGAAYLSLKFWDKVD